MPLISKGAISLMIKNNVFICPVCGKTLTVNGAVMKCELGHSYDISSANYVNLAMNQSGKTHGDDALMVNSRRTFLSGGYYARLRESVLDALRLTRSKTVLDAGCGEGYYTHALGTLPNATVYGIDISKKAVASAGRLCRGDSYGIFCVGSVYSMPYASGSFDAIVNIFSPLALDEYKRILKTCGYLVLAVPNQEHLIELKRAVYDDVRIKEDVSDTIDGFELVNKKRVNYTFTPENIKALEALFAMTPYYYTTPAEMRQRITENGTFDITADFSVITYLRKL